MHQRETKRRQRSPALACWSPQRECRSRSRRRRRNRLGLSLLGFVLRRGGSFDLTAPPLRQKSLNIQEHIAGVNGHRQKQDQIAHHFATLFHHHAPRSAVGHQQAQLPDDGRGPAQAGEDKARRRSAAGAHLQQQPHAERAQHHGVGPDPPEGAVAHQPLARRMRHQLFKTFVQAASFVDAHHEPDGCRPEPDAVAAVVIVQPMPAQRPDDQAQEARGQQHQRGEPGRQASFTVQVEGGNAAVGRLLRQPRHPVIQCLQAGDQQHACQKQQHQRERLTRNEIGNLRLSCHACRLAVSGRSPPCACRGAAFRSRGQPRLNAQDLVLYHAAAPLGALAGASEIVHGSRRILPAEHDWRKTGIASRAQTVSGPLDEIGISRKRLNGSAERGVLANFTATPYSAL